MFFKVTNFLLWLVVKQPRAQFFLRLVYRAKQQILIYIVSPISSKKTEKGDCIKKILRNLYFISFEFLPKIKLFTLMCSYLKCSQLVLPFTCTQYLFLYCAHVNFFYILGCNIINS
ncbi:MAG: hypothetical protein EAZ64_05220 [Sphingobacteriales bacterium]|nr:MAG: hypothetical protein EAZ64_05220 [Sphingobacteriales bacterium]